MTPREKDLLQYIKRYTFAHNGVMPSHEEMARGLNLKSKSSIHRLLRGLQERGHINKLPSRARAIEIKTNNQIWIDGEYICVTSLSLKEFCEKTGCSMAGAEMR